MWCTREIQGMNMYLPVYREVEEYKSKLIPKTRFHRREQLSRRTTSSCMTTVTVYCMPQSLHLNELEPLSFFLFQPSQLLRIPRPLPNLRSKLVKHKRKDTHDSAKYAKYRAGPLVPHYSMRSQECHVDLQRISTILVKLYNDEAKDATERF